MAQLSINFKSKALKMPVVFDAIIPQGHGNYKTLYLLHGAGGDHGTWLYRSRVADYAEKKNIAIIMPSGNNKCYVNNFNGKDYYDYIAKELPEYVENIFSVSRDKKDRYIAGMSMGGYGAFYAALRNPERYNTAFSYSGFLDMKKVFLKENIIDVKTVFGTEETFKNGGYDLYEYLKNVDKLKLISYCGDDDFTLEINREFAKNAKEAGVNIEYKEGKGGHNFDYWDACLRETMEYIDNSQEAGHGSN